MEEFKPDWYCPPGATINETLKLKGLSNEDLAKALNKTIPWCNKLILGEEEIDDFIANKLSEFLGGSKAFWINLEKNYRDDKERITGSRN